MELNKHIRWEQSQTLLFRMQNWMTTDIPYTNNFVGLCKSCSFSNLLLTVRAIIKAKVAPLNINKMQLKRLHKNSIRDCMANKSFRKSANNSKEQKLFSILSMQLHNSGSSSIIFDRNQIPIQSFLPSLCHIQLPFAHPRFTLSLDRGLSRYHYYPKWRKGLLRVPNFATMDTLCQ